MLLLLASRSANARVEAGAVATFVVPTTAPMEMEGGSKRTFVLGMPCMTGHHTVSPVLLLNLALRLVQSQLDTPQPLWLLSAGVFYPRARGAIPQMGHAGLWGLVRTARIEEPTCAVRCLDVDALRAQCSATCLEGVALSDAYERERAAHERAAQRFHHACRDL